MTFPGTPRRIRHDYLHLFPNMMKLKLLGLKVGVISLVSYSVLLVVLSMMISELLVKVNTVKNAVSGMANALAAVCFALFGDVRWAFVRRSRRVSWLVDGSARRSPGRCPPGPFRVIVSLCGIGLAVKLGMSAYR
jgi:hypothetical protein